jgi:hypothetical protein
MSDVIGNGELTTKVRLFDTLIQRVSRLEAELCFYTMEVEELGSQLGRLRTIQSYFERMEKEWGVHRNLARQSLEEVFAKHGVSDSTVYRMMPPEIKDPIKRANRLGKTRPVAQAESSTYGTTYVEKGVGAAYQEPD